MRRIFMGAVAAALLFQTAAHANQSEGPAKPSWDMITFETRHFELNRPPTKWILSPEGKGSWTEIIRHGKGDYETRLHVIRVGAKGYAELEALLKTLPDPAPDDTDCDDLWGDFPNGTLRMTRGATTIEIAWNSGCRDARYKRLLDILMAADKKVGEWGMAGKVVTERSSPPEN
jgi:hypothetical protein